MTKKTTVKYYDTFPLKIFCIAKKYSLTFTVGKRSLVLSFFLSSKVTVKFLEEDKTPVKYKKYNKEKFGELIPEIVKFLKK